MFTNKMIPALSVAALMISGGAALAADQTHAEAGSLSCDVSEETGYVFGSTKELNCTFNPVQEGVADETYVGTIKRYGIDIGKTENGKMSWLVLAPTDEGYAEGALTGEYGGVSGEATLGVGLGANVMIGGSKDTVALQPVSLTTQNGVNFAVGIAEMELTKVKG